jgi:cholesterol oxidase
MDEPPVCQDGRRLRLSTRQDPENPTPTFLPVANDIARRLADRTGDTAQSWLTEALFNMPITAHILGGAVAAATSETGVVDGDHRVFGYQNLLICDGAVIAANPGVNPSLTITASGAGNGRNSGHAGRPDDNRREGSISPKTGSGVSQLGR